VRKIAPAVLACGEIFVPDFAHTTILPECLLRATDKLESYNATSHRNASGLRALTVPASHAAAQQVPNSFHFQEATIAGIHDAFAAGQLTCAQLTKLYLARIDAYDRRGPSLHAIIRVNPRAMETATEMDRQYAASRSGVGPLHCIPIILKDNFDTSDMPTTAGNIAMKNSLPPADAFAVQKIRKAGALILAKANMSEFARGGMSVSSLGGQVLNPYDLTRTPGGSSGGTGAAIAANFAVIGTGSDTGQSIRSPASANNLVGIRPTRGLISRSGIVPNSLTQDEIGPIARTVTDAALLLDVMAGYDPADPITAFGNRNIPRSYAELLNKEALRGSRIGVMTDMFGTAESNREVNKVMEGVISTMESLGATMVRFELPEYEKLETATPLFEARTVMEKYFPSWGRTLRSRTLPSWLRQRRPQHKRLWKKKSSSSMASIARPTMTAC
jgi:Asp-tRNA(Asn)/Glu-tRNA(Gln) amidotransferase A subunit family amidase